MVENKLVFIDEDGVEQSDPTLSGTYSSFECEFDCPYCHKYCRADSTLPVDASITPEYEDCPHCEKPIQMLSDAWTQEGISFTGSSTRATYRTPSEYSERYFALEYPEIFEAQQTAYNHGKTGSVTELLSSVPSWVLTTGIFAGLIFSASPLWGAYTLLTQNSGMYIFVAPLFEALSISGGDGQILLGLVFLLVSVPALFILAVSAVGLRVKRTAHMDPPSISGVRWAYSIGLFESSDRLPSPTLNGAKAESVIDMMGNSQAQLSSDDEDGLLSDN